MFGYDCFKDADCCEGEICENGECLKSTTPPTKPPTTPPTTPPTKPPTTPPTTTATSTSTTTPDIYTPNPSGPAVKISVCLLPGAGMGRSSARQFDPTIEVSIITCRSDEHCIPTRLSKIYGHDVG